MTLTTVRAGMVEPFHVMRILAEARRMEAQGVDIVHMEVGEPDFPSPAPIVAAGGEALQRGDTRYTPALGLPALREAIAAYYLERFDVGIPASRIVITPGASGALQLMLTLLAEANTSVLMADPGYPCNRNLVHLADAVPISVPVGPESNFQLTPAAVVSAWREDTRLVIVTTPSNPTGSVLSLAELGALQQTVRDEGGTFIVDEIYQGLSYDEPPTTALKLGPDVVVINSFSKYFGMTGWRLGWLVAPEPLIPALDKLAQNLYLAPSTPAQYAALAAFRPETMAELERRRAEFQRRRDYLADALEGLGFRLGYRPAGAFYLYADCTAFGQDSDTLARRLLEEAHVAVTPGRDFEQHAPAKHIRFAYTADIDRLREGVRRIKGLLAG